MRVTREDTLTTVRANISQSRSRTNTALQASLMILALVLGFTIHQQAWHHPLFEFAESFIQHPSFAVSTLFHRSDLATLRMNLRFEDYQILLDDHTLAQQLGAIITSDSDYVPATIDYADTAVIVQLRLLEGPVDKLSSEVWPFDIVVEDNGTLLGLRRFTLVPTDDTAIMTWGYLETLRRAGLQSPRYHFVRLILNGAPKGIYTMEECNSVESSGVQEEPGSAIAYFESDAYWNAYTQLGTALPGSGFQYAQHTVNCAPPPMVQNDNVYTTDVNIPSSVCVDALHTLQALCESEIVPSEALDPEKTGAFLALTMLWRGTSQLDWRTVHLAYDPDTARFEPIGAGATLSPIAPLPDCFTDDPKVRIAYARALAQFSLPDYLTQLQADLKDDIEALQLALGTEMGYLNHPWATLREHQAEMRHQITPLRTLFASIESDDAILALRLSNVQPFPIEIIGLDIGENALIPVSPTWVVESDRESTLATPETVVLHAAAASMPRPVHIQVPLDALPIGSEWERQSPDAIRILTRVYGLTNQTIVVTATSDDAAIHFHTEERVQ